jgi:heme b synthase
MTGILKLELRMIAWEITRSCNLNCLHCRAAAERGPYKGELTTEECFRFIDDVAAFNKPVMIFTGGEPLLREDIFEIASYATHKGLRVVMAVNGTLLNAKKARSAKQAGIQRVSLSLDGATAEAHDRFRGVIGAFAGAMEGIRYLRESSIDFQINTTVTQRNVSEIGDILQLAIRLGAVALHIFLLVPVGRGRDLVGEEVTSDAYERTLIWLAEQEAKVPLQIKATCAPQYHRIIHQQVNIKDRKKGRVGLHAFTRGCLGGITFCFISHLGNVQPCGYLEILGGSIREKPFEEIWTKADVFQQLRNINHLKGKCGQCEYRVVCGGCRARAYAFNNDYLGEEPLCPYEPQGRHQPKKMGFQSEIKKPRYSFVK